MTAYETLWDFAEDHYGIVTTSQAVAMGIDKHQLPADEGAIEADRIADAAAKAHDEGLLTEADMNKFIQERS